MKLCIASYMVCTCVAATAGKRIPITMRDYLFPIVTLNVGTPPQELQVEFDSGSPLFWSSNVESCNFNDTYNPANSSTSEDGQGNVSFVYGTGYIEGKNNSDIVVLDDINDSNFGGRMLVVPATLVANMPGSNPNCSTFGRGIVGMNMDSTFMNAVFENDPDVDKYYVTDFNIDVPGRIRKESYFEIGSFPANETSEEPFCVKTLPKTEEDRLGSNVVLEPNQPVMTFTFWWQYEVDYFKIGDMKSTGMAQTFVDDGTSVVGGNFTSIFSPNPVPKDLCKYLKETNSTFDVVPPGGQRPTSLSYEDLYIGDPDDDSGTCMMVQMDLPENLIISGLPFYNKYLIKHDYENEEVCFAVKKEYSSLLEVMSSAGTTGSNLHNGNKYNNLIIKATTIAAAISLLFF